MIERLLAEMNAKGITIYKLSQLTDIKYELLRRIFRHKRKLTADELILILDSTEIDFEKIR